MKVIILAGGSGTRLWPISRASKPKQVQAFLDSSTLLQHTWDRLRKGFKAQDIFVATVAGQAGDVKRQLPQIKTGNLILEPIARNTAAAIGLVAKVMATKFPHEVVAVVSSDHYIANAQEYLLALKDGDRAVRTYPDHLILLGVTPNYPETGYGYIKYGAIKKRFGKLSVFRVVTFAEKPSLVKAQQYLKSGKYLWNAGLFVFYPETLLGLIKKVAPKLADGLDSLSVLMGKNIEVRISKLEYSKLLSISFDYAVVEKVKKLLVIPMNCGWTDVGHWRTIYDILATSPRANVVRGNHIGINSHGNLVYAMSGKLVATVGVSDLVIVETKDALLICPKSEAQNVRMLVEEMKKIGMRKYL